MTRPPQCATIRITALYGEWQTSALARGWKPIRLKLCSGLRPPPFPGRLGGGDQRGGELPVEGEEVFDTVPVAEEGLGPATAVHRAVQLPMRLDQRPPASSATKAACDQAAATLPGRKGQLLELESRFASSETERIRRRFSTIQQLTPLRSRQAAEKRLFLKANRLTSPNGVWPLAAIRC